MKTSKIYIQSMIIITLYCQWCRNILYTSHNVNAWSLQDDADYDEYWNEEHDDVACYQGEASFCHEYYSAGTCSRINCRLVHGHLCDICENFALHPSDLEAVEQHKVECRSRHEKLQARSRSSNVDCSICLEKVLNKAGDRKFGLLNCEHPFCLSCIRNWRSQTGVADVDSVRTCMTDTKLDFECTYDPFLHSCRPCGHVQSVG